MYRTVSADEYRRHLGLPGDYRVDGVLIYGAPHRRKHYDMMRECAGRSAGLGGVEVETLQGFLEPVMGLRLRGVRLWFATAYGGAMLSEWLHFACLFGSRMNVLLGSCGGLHAEAGTHDLIVPTYSYADESTTRAYEPAAGNRHRADGGVRDRLSRRLEAAGHRVWAGPTVTHQAMLAETWEDVRRWSQAGYLGVEMEAATTFAVSNHFGVPSAAALHIADNLVTGGTVLDAAYAAARQRRQAVARDLFDAALAEMPAPAGG